MPSTAHVSDNDRHDIWNQWLDGDTVNRIHAYQAGDLSRGVIKAVLDEEPPDSIRNDARLVHGGRFFWISVSHHYPKAADDKEMVFVIVKMPYRMTGRMFSKGVRAVRREFRELHPESDLSLGVLEGVDAEAAIRFVGRKGFYAWSMDEEGSVSRFAISPGDEPATPTAFGP